MRKIFALHRGKVGGLDAVPPFVALIEPMIEAEMSLTERIIRSATPPRISRPDPALVIAGDPVHTTWNIHDDRGLYCGLWQSTPGTWRVSYSEWEYVHIHTGFSVLTRDDGSVTELRAGQSWIIRPGFAGTWAVIETTLKDYVILDRP